MPFVSDTALDQAANWVKTNGTRVDICSAEPTTYTAATSTLSLGNKTGVVATGPTDGAVDGRRTTIPAITDGSVTATGTATHWALTDNAAILVATGALSASQAVTAGNTFTLTEHYVTFRDAVTV